MQLHVKRPFQYLLLYTSKPLEDDVSETLEDVFKGFLGYLDIEKHDNYMVLFFDNLEEVDFRDIHKNLNTEFMMDIGLFLSPVFNDYDQAFMHLTWTKSVLISNTTTHFSAYMEERDVIKHHVSTTIPEITKKMVFKELIHDPSFLHAMKVFLACNQNTSKAAEQLYLHRNTLINRLDKFYAVTGYDLRNFEDAVIVYALLINY